MDCCLPYSRIPIAKASPSAVKSGGDSKAFLRFTSDFSDNISFASQRRICDTRRFGGRIWFNDKRSIRTVLIAAASAESSHCGYRNEVDWPLEARSSAGKFLTSVLQNQRHLFDVAVTEQLNELAADRDGAIARKQHSEGSPESCLHRRIVELKEHECQIAVEDVMYMLIVRRFSEIKVDMVPRLSRCINNGRIEGLLSKDRELESIYSIEVLEMVREHVSTILGWRGKSNISENWINRTTTQMQRLQLGQVYAASIMYGYFLKSACLRHNLERSLALTNHDFPLGHGIHVPITEFQYHRLENLVAHSHSINTWATSLSHVSGRHSRKQDKLRCYVMRFDPETLQRCAKIKSQEAVNLIEKHSWALFGDEMGAFESDEAIDVTFASLKRFVLEAVAFGYFLWDVEGYVDSVYRLKESW
ncbi:UV-B-induced protein At3g17800, chloroplastic-like isoform X2 [Telopea speciosissima]|uniref:UV-B-induced protein At3g17800, chloroplastic-like isoform X2 n=1 Tax=Telopea speciosissima TaxID=54955 RepID=UPI001CC7C00C|nr:UV-B-induced protein At3g17800, chloroplastic-like isoform X2 [Telopea speciosissima]